MNRNTHCPHCGADLTDTTRPATIEYHLEVISDESWHSRLLPNGEIDHRTEYLDKDSVQSVTFENAFCRACGYLLSDITGD